MSRPSCFSRRPPRLHQHGIVSIVAAILLIAVVVFILSQTYGIIGNTSNSNASQADSAKAFFAAESGLERGLATLKSASDPTSQSACEANVPGTFSLDSNHSFTLSAKATGCSGLSGCTSCTITSTGTVASSSRTVVSEFSVSAPSGGATGCGGGGGATVDEGNCASAPITDKRYPKIEQTIEIKSTELPVILMSNMAYLRHPAGAGGATIKAAECVTVPPSTCLTEWNDESSTSNGSVVVGSRGASDTITSITGTSATYTLSQTLTGDSLFSAVGAKITGASGMAVVGSYWDDVGNSGLSTRANSQTTDGETNDGALCDPVTCPPDKPPQPPNVLYGSAQTKTSWCYGADTLVMGFSGRSANGASGNVTSFTFGSAPTALAQQIPNGFAPYPKPSGSLNSELFSTMWQLKNPYYLSSNSGAGATSYRTAVKGTNSVSATVSLTKGSKAMTVTTLGGRLCYGDTLNGSSSLGGSGDTSTIDQDGVLITAISGTESCSSSTGTYQLADASDGSGPNGTVYPNLNLTSLSSRFVVSGTTPNGATLTNAITNEGVTVLGSTASAGVVVTYTISPANSLAPAILTQGTSSTSVITLPDTNVPAVGTIVNLFSGTGRLAYVDVDGNSSYNSSKDYPKGLTVVACPGSACTANQFAVDTTGLPGDAHSAIKDAILCGGICAFFNRNPSYKSGKTPFTVANTNTQQWAAGMTCLSGASAGEIIGLIGNNGIVKSTKWYEQVK